MPRSSDMIRAWIDGFFRDCRVRDLSAYTLEYYRQQLAAFTKFAECQGVTEVPQITADLLRAYLLDLEATGHNAGGRHAKYRAVRVFLNWYQAEAEPDGWVNPIVKVKPPKVARDVIEGANVDHIRAMIATCGDNYTGLRDRAVILCLLDTGARAREFLSLDLSDVDTISGSVILRKTKNRKQRIVFLGRKSRRAVRAYLKQRQDQAPALWVTRAGERIAVKTLQGMLERRAKLAGVPGASPHDFRRAFALLMLRAGTDVITLARLMGHSSLEILTRYLKQTSEDLHAAHERAGIVDRMI